MDPAEIGQRIQQSYPQYGNVDPVKLGNAYLQRYGQAVSGVTSGVIDIKDIPEKQRVGVSLGLEASGYKQQTEEEKKQEGKVSDLSKSVKILEKNFREIEGQGAVGGRVAKLLSGITGGSINPEVSDYEALRKSLIGPLARAISGEVGVLTDKDISRAEGLLPKVTDSKALSERKLNNLKQVIKEKGGDAGEEQPLPKGANILESILSGSRSVAKDVGVGLAQRGEGARTQAAQEQARQLSQQVTQRATQESNPEQLQRLLRLSQQTGQVLSESKQPQFSQNIDNNYTGRGVGAAMEVAATAELVNLATKIPSLPSKLKNIKSPFKAAGITRDTAVAEAEKAGVKFKTAPLRKAVKQYVSDDPLAEKTADRVLQGLTDKELSPSQLMRKLKVWNKAYTAASKVGKSSKAGLYDVLAKTAKDDIATKAPEVAKATELFTRLFKFQKAGKRVVNPIVGTGIGIAAGGLFGTLLGRK